MKVVLDTNVLLSGLMDPNVILAALIASGAEHLITGDSDLLALRDHFPIMTPAEFVQRL